jgi:hypothetical protein
MSLLLGFPQQGMSQPLLNVHITAPDGSSIPGATVEVLDLSGDVVTTGVSDATGNLRLFLLPGEYNVRAALDGFSVRIFRIDVSMGQSSVAEIQLDNLQEVDGRGEEEEVPVPEPFLPSEEAGAEIEQKGQTSHPAWNIWEETRSRSGRYRPLLKLLTGHDYQIGVDLATLVYTGGAGLYHQEVSDSLRRWLSRRSPETVDLTLLIVPDDSRISILGRDRVQTLPVEFERLREAIETDQRSAEPPLKTLQSGVDPHFRLGSAIFPFRTKSTSGLSAFVLSVWADQRPIDEIAVPICIVEHATDDCPQGSAVDAIDLQGADSLRGDPVVVPDLALHLVELNTDQVIGVLRCNFCGWSKSTFITWDLDSSRQQIEAALSSTLSD